MVDKSTNLSQLRAQAHVAGSKQAHVASSAQAPVASPEVRKLREQLAIAEERNLATDDEPATMLRHIKVLQLELRSRTQELEVSRAEALKKDARIAELEQQRQALLDAETGEPGYLNIRIQQLLESNAALEELQKGSQRHFDAHLGDQKLLIQILEDKTKRLEAQLMHLSGEH